MKLQEGKNYFFKLEGLVELPDGRLYHRLSDPNNIKHLLPAEPYEEYDLESQDEIICHVDKINCSGRIFLEPEHPFYKIDKEYPFPVIGFEEIENSEGREEAEIILKDMFGKKISIPAAWFPEVKNTGEEVMCRIGRIKKGELMLIPVSGFDNTQFLKAGSEIILSISEILTLSGDMEFFVLKDDKGRKYYLRKKFYEEYELQKDQLLICRVMQQNEEVFLEPKHPHYDLGMYYDFEILREDFIEDYPDKNVPVIVIFDVYNKEYYLRKDQFISKDVASVHAWEKVVSISCLVAEIIKGRLVLQCN